MVRRTRTVRFASTITPAATSVRLPPRACFEYARVVAVLDTSPPKSPTSTSPWRTPTIFSAMYPASDSPEMSTTISQMRNGLSAP